MQVLTADERARFEEQRGLDCATLADVEPEAIDWLWRGRIARGKVTMLVGDPGDGKSYLSLAIASAVSRGDALPDGEKAAPADCLLWNGEDGLEDTIRVRAERVGADLQRVHVIRGKLDAEGHREPFGLHHVLELREEIERRGNVALVVVDPIGALLGGVDAHRDAEVRSALQPLADVALETGVALCVVAHLNKSSANRSIYRVGGSIGFVGLARSVLLVAIDQDSGRRAVVQMKSNIAEQAAPVEFRIDDDGLWWMGLADELNADRLLAPAMDGNERSARDEARAAILEAINDAGGDILGKELDRIITDAGVTRKTYERARAALVRDRKIERRGGNRYQRDLRWATLGHDGPKNKYMAETTTLAETTFDAQPTDGRDYDTLGQNNIVSLNNNSLGHGSESTRARVKLCKGCRRLRPCDPKRDDLCVDCEVA